MWAPSFSLSLSPSNAAEKRKRAKLITICCLYSALPTTLPETDSRTANAAGRAGAIVAVAPNNGIGVWSCTQPRAEVKCTPQTDGKSLFVLSRPGVKSRRRQLFFLPATFKKTSSNPIPSDKEKRTDEPARRRQQQQLSISKVKSVPLVWI